MKKIVALALIAMMSLSLAACGNNTDNASDTTAQNTETSAPAENSASGESSAPAEESGSDASGTESSDAQTVTINMMGEDIEASVTINGDTFEASYAFKDNDVIAKGTVNDDGSLTVEEYTPDSVPEQYVQGAVDLIADEL